VEQMAAAASSLSSQAQELVKMVADFKLNDGQQEFGIGMRSPQIGSPANPVVRSSVGTMKPVNTTDSTALPKPVVQAKASSNAGASDWESF